MTDAHKIALRRSLVFFSAAMLAGLGVVLGIWQLQRAAYKEALGIRFANIGKPTVLRSAADLDEWQRVSVQGRWLADQSVLLDNRVRNGHAGYEVLTPLRIENGGGIVIVNRGWLPLGQDRAHLPAISTTATNIHLQGLAVRAVNPGFNLASPTQEGRVWQRADLASFQRKLGEPVANWLLRQEGGIADGLDRRWSAPDFGTDMHRAYAFQWFALSLTCIALTWWYGLRRRGSAASPTLTSKRPTQ